MVGTKARVLNGIMLWYSGEARNMNEVGILVDMDLREQVVEVMKGSDGIISIMIVVRGPTLRIINVYASQVGLDEDVKKQFW